ncbi:MAG TPA: ATP-binding protein [Telluria sp.]|nr:ATP-binding protein [Telluria sp.]
MGKLEVAEPELLGANAATLEREMAWASRVIEAGIRLYFEQECEVAEVRALEPPGLVGDASPYAVLLREHGMGFEQRFVLILALLVHLRPHLLDPFLIRNTNFERSFTEFGGMVAPHGGFQPTLETAAFVLAGASLERRLALARLFDPDQPLRRARLLELGEGTGPGLFASALKVHPGRLHSLICGTPWQPSFSSEFPARRLGTGLEWDELVANEELHEAVDEVRAWIEHGHELVESWGLGRHVRPGLRVLFYGPPGTGKTLTAALLGKRCGMDVYRLDLAQTVSKYIGETEKNLGRVFDMAEHERWILFFDEADALFGKRGAANSANDRYANQEVAYLLQRIEDYPGVVILATNLKGNIDEAFARRFQAMVYFPQPDREERLRLWRQACGARLPPGADLGELADRFDISGGAIGNVLRHAALMALRRGSAHLHLDDLREGALRELRKEGRFVPASSSSFT